MINQIEKLKSNSENKIEVLRTKGNVEIERLKVENEILKTKSQFIDTQKENSILSKKFKMIKNSSKSGFFLSMLALISCAASTILSLTSGYNIIDNNSLSFIAFTMVMIISQGLIYFISAYNTRIKEDYSQYYKMSQLMEYAMLFVSITFNIMYFYNLYQDLLITILISPLCIILDFSIILFNSLGYDIKNHITYKSNDLENDIEKDLVKNSDVEKKDLNLIGTPMEKRLIGFKPYKMHDLENDIENDLVKFSDVENDLENNLVKNSDVENDLEKGSLISDFKKNELEKIINDVEIYINENYAINEPIRTKDIKSKFNITDNTWTRKIKHNLKCLEIKNKKCFRK